MLNVLVFPRDFSGPFFLVSMLRRLGLKILTARRPSGIHKGVLYCAVVCKTYRIVHDENRFFVEEAHCLVDIDADVLFYYYKASYSFTTRPSAHQPLIHEWTVTERRKLLAEKTMDRSLSVRVRGR